MDMDTWAATKHGPIVRADTWHMPEHKAAHAWNMKTSAPLNVGYALGKLPRTLLFTCWSVGICLAWPKPKLNKFCSAKAAAADEVHLGRKGKTLHIHFLQVLNHGETNNNTLKPDELNDPSAKWSPTPAAATRSCTVS
jgi:hypothetical protein